MKKSYLLWIVYVLMLVVTMMSASAEVTQDDLLDGLVSYWKFDETSGDTAVDSHGDNDGTIEGATIDQTGIINKAYYFDAATDNVNIDNPFSGVDSFGINFWVEIDTIGTSTDSSERNYFITSSGSSGNRPFVLWVDNDGDLVVYVNGAILARISNPQLAIETKYMITVNYDGNTIKTYLNKDEISSESFSSTLETHSELSIGNHPGTTNQLNGMLIDEVAIWDRALTSDEVSALYDIQKDGYTSGSYDFSALEGEGSVTVSTSAATSVTSVGATLNGDLTNINDETSVDVSFRYREKDDTGSWTTTSKVSKSATGTFSESITGLSYNTEYEYQAVVEWDTSDEAFGTLTYFTTNNPTIGAPSITTGTTYDDSYYKGEITIRSSISDFDNVQCQYSINDGSSWLSADAISGFCEKTGLTPNTNIDVKFRARSGSTGAWVTSSTKSYTYDNTAPSSLSFSPNSRDWGNTDVLVMTSAVDSGSGLDKSSMLFCFTSSSSCVPNNALVGIDPPTFESGNDIYEFTISNNGETRMCFNIADNLGTTSETSCSGIYKVDKTSPTTSGEITSGSAITEGENTGIYFTDVVYTITPADTFSGVASTEYCVDSTNTCTPNTAYTTPITINTNGDHYIRFRSTDNAGNVQTTQSSGLIERDNTLVTYFTITLKDAYTNEDINNFCVQQTCPPGYFCAHVIGLFEYSECTTTGSLVTTYEYQNEDISLEFFNISNTGSEQTHFSFFETVSMSENFAGEAAQAYLDISLFEIITNEQINTSFIFTINNETNINKEDLPLPISAGTHEVTITKNGYYSYSENITIEPLTTYTAQAELHDAELTIDVKNAWNNETLTNFTGWISNEDYSFNQSFTSNDSSIILPLKKDLNYTVFVDNPDFAINETVNFANIFLNESSQNLTLYIYTINSIRINAFKEEDGSPINQLINVLVTSSAFEQSYNFTDASTIIEELPDGVYNLRFDSESFTTRSYTVTVASRSTQELSIYLSNSTGEVTFTVQEEGSSKAISEARISMYRFLNGEWVTVESKLTDITGKAVLTYLSGERYKFVVSKDDYISKTFELNPILLSSYTVRLNKRETFPDIPQIFTASVDFTPKRFVQGNNNLTLFFNSPEGRLAEYGFVVSYPGGSYSFDGTNAIGETHVVNFDITGAEFLDTVNLTYNYRLVGGVMQTRSFTLPILDVAPDLSFADLRNNDYGLSTFEKLIIVTLTILLVGGLVLLTAGSVVGGAVVVLLLAWFGFLGFIPVWSLAIVILAGITYLTSKGV